MVTENSPTTEINMRTNLEAARQYLAKCPPAISGQGGDKHTFCIALKLARDFNLTEDEAFRVMAEWNQRCVPPWTTFDLLRKLRAADAVPVKTDRLMSDTEASGRELQKPKPHKSAFRPMVSKRIAAKTAAIPDIHAFLENSSPVVVGELDTVDVLRTLYPTGSGEKVLVFSNMKSQGQFVWVADHSEAIQAGDLPAGPDGVWILPQPVTGKYHPNPRMDGKPSRRSEEAVTAWRYAVLESDEAEPENWLRCLVQLPLRIACICESGGRSIHALVQIDAISKQDWDARIATIKPILVTLGADPAALTAVRLTRLPQARRGNRVQRLLYLNPAPSGSPIFGAKAKGSL